MNNENLINNGNLVCSRCGGINMPNTKFCIKCGNPLQMVPTNTDFNSSTINSTFNTETVYQPSVSQEIKPQFAQVSQQDNTPNINIPIYTQNNNVPVSSQNINYFKYILNVIIKPFDTFKKEEKNLSNFKNSAIIMVIVVIALTILNLISTMITSVRVTSFWSKEVEWVWENLKNIEYFKIIGQNLLTYSGIIIAISGVYFLASLILKREAKFVKFLSATTTAFIPLAVSISILSPLVALIYTYLGIVVTIVGLVYFLVILLELMNELIKIENKNTRIYFHLTCLSILIIGGGFIAYKLVLGSLTSGLGSLFG